MAARPCRAGAARRLSARHWWHTDVGVPLLTDSFQTEVLRCGTLWRSRVSSVLNRAHVPDGLVGHVDTTLEQEFLHIAGAQREAIIEPDAMADDLAGEAMVRIAFGVSGWRHVGCFS